MQTIEAINHAKAAKVPIIVAINKIDKPSANIDRVKKELLREGLVAEELGGDTIIVPVSALHRINLDQLEDAILLVAEMQDLKANPNAKAVGVIVEARIDKSQGVIAVGLVQRGTLQKSDIIVAGQSYGKVKKLNSDKLENISNVGPSDPVEIYGLNSPPKAGDIFNVVENEKQARDITEYRIRMAKSKSAAIINGKITTSSLDDLFLKAAGTQSFKELKLIIKCDVQGSVEAIANSLLKISTDGEVQLKILHSAVGGITESDLSLAQASSAIILGFNVRANTNVTSAQDKVDIRYYSIIYDLIDDVKAIMSGMLSPIIREEYIGSVEIRQVFNISKSGKIAGSYVTKGIIKKGANVRLLRDNIVVHEGKLKTLKRFKDEVKEVRENFECGIAFENYENIQVGDIVEVFEVIQEKKKL
jgi:translation initiation factor IF-2